MSRIASAPFPLKLAAGLLAAFALFGTAALVAALIALAGLGRLSADLQLSAVPGWFWYFRADPEVRRWLTIGALFAGGGLALAGLAALRGLRPPLHGAARWAREDEIALAGLRAAQGVVLGRKGGRLLVFGGQEHVLLHAPTRSGKGVGVVIPTLLTWPDSVVVLDVKRENFEASAGYRAAHGQTVWLFDPLDPEGRTARYNPLGHIDRQDPAEVIEELQKLAVMLFPIPPGSDPFWSEAARTGFIGVGAYLAETPARAFTLGEIYAELTTEDPRARFAELISHRARDGAPLTAACVSALRDFSSASENTFASIKQTVTTKLGLWLSPRIRAATAVSDFDLREVRRRRVSLYLAVSPDNLLRTAPLYNLLFQQLVDLNTRERPSPDGPPVRVLVVLDEFARLGQASVLAHAFAYVAGYGLRVLAVLQSPAQLRALYGPDLAEEIVTNCGVEIAFAPKDLKTAQDLSERMGFFTYPGRSSSRPAGLSSGRRSVSETAQRRALLMPQEVMRLGGNELLLLKAGLWPVRARKIAYYRERAFAARVQAPPAIAPHAGSATDGRASSDLGRPAPGGDEQRREPRVERRSTPPGHDASDRELSDWLQAEMRKKR